MLLTQFFMNFENLNLFLKILFQKFIKYNVINMSAVVLHQMLVQFLILIVNGKYTAKSHF